MIVTHRATTKAPHFTNTDEVTAICLILAKTNDKDVYRKDVSKEELHDPKCWVVDTGGLYDPSLKNFDRRAKNNSSGACSAQLVAEHLGLTFAYSSYMQYLNFGMTSTKDALLSQYAIDVPYNNIVSPFEKYFQYLSVPKEGTTKLSNSVIWTLTSLGRGIVTELQNTQASVEEYTKNPVTEYNGRRVIFMKNVRGLWWINKQPNKRADVVVSEHTSGTPKHTLWKLNPGEDSWNMVARLGIQGIELQSPAKLVVTGKNLKDVEKILEII